MENFNYEQFSDEIILNFFMKINDNNDKELAEECQKILNNCLISRVTITSYLNNITFFHYKKYNDLYDDILSSIYVMYTTYKAENKLHLLSDEFKSLIDENYKSNDNPLLKYSIIHFITAIITLSKLKNEYPKVYSKL